MKGKFSPVFDGDPLYTDPIITLRDCIFDDLKVLKYIIRIVNDDVEVNIQDITISNSECLNEQFECTLIWL